MSREGASIFNALWPAAEMKRAFTETALSWTTCFGGDFAAVAGAAACWTPFGTAAGAFGALVAGADVAAGAGRAATVAGQANAIRMMPDAAAGASRRPNGVRQTLARISRATGLILQRASSCAAAHQTCGRWFANAEAAAMALGIGLLFCLYMS
ncbi:hypothetical protein [Rhodanobacter sp. FW106-PBR-LB-2-19]|uniref:hypothetical protein n=1 Tax=Rhodanobacter sp. FW106-PBR-LB-2-19 TaxID=2766737 RepID=UPI0034E6063B